MKIPDKKSDPQGAIRLLMTLNPKYNEADAEAILKRGSQYEDKVNYLQEKLNRFYLSDQKGLAKRAAQLRNYAGYIKNGKITQAQYNSVVQNALKGIGGEAAVLKELEAQRKFLDKFGDFLDDNEKSRFNSVAQNVLSTFAPTIDQARYTFRAESDKNKKEIQLLQNAIANHPNDTAANERRQRKIDELSGSSTQTGGTSPMAVGQNEGNKAPQGQTSGLQGYASNNRQAAIDFINQQNLPEDVKQMYITVVENWDPNTEFNPQKVIDAFIKIKNTTIDPRFQGLANIAISSVQNTVKNMETQRRLELESEATNKALDIQNTQAGLEASGLTFSGKGVEQLGTDLSATVPFGGTRVEGLIPKKHRFIATSSEAAYKNNLKNIGLSAEEQLGSGRVKGLIAGYAPVGSVVGSLNESKQAAEGAVLGNIMQQQAANKAQGETLTF